jgi:hypothetical protein
LTRHHATIGTADELTMRPGSVTDLLVRQLLPHVTGNTSPTRIAGEGSGEVDVPPELKKSLRQLENPVQVLPAGGGLMTNFIPSGLDDLLCLPKRLHIVIAARRQIALADLCRSVGDIKGTYRYQAYTLARAKYVTIHLSSSSPPSLIIETTALGRKQLTKHIAAVHTLMRNLGVTEPLSTAIPPTTGTPMTGALSCMSLAVSRPRW